MGRAAWQKGRSTTLLLMGLLGCGADSFELQSGDVATESQADTTPEPSDVVQNEDDSSLAGVDVPSGTSDIAIDGPTDTAIVLPPQAVYDLPAVETITNRPHWRWVAKQPSLSKSRFIPSDDYAAPSMELNVAGDYVFELHAWEEAEGLPEIVWTQRISVISGPGIHIELLWVTPNDEDETDEGAQAGSDLDLHFVHRKYAVGAGYDGDGDGIDDPWFNNPFDVFWFTPQPNWGALDQLANDDPSIDRDDRDGSGPENINLVVPESGAVYGIGVHYWSDNGFGDAYATVRTYVDGLLIDERTQHMSNRDMWDVGTLDWPSGVFTPTLRPNGSHLVTPSYENPNFTE